MENILKKAHELGELLAESTELAEFQEMETTFFSDEDAQAAVAEYEKKSAELSKEMHSTTMTAEKLESFRQKMNENMAELTQNATAKAYLEAKSKFNRIITQVNEIIGYHIRGCSGCH